MKRAKYILLALLVVCIAIQFFQPARNQSGQGQPMEFFSMYSTPDSVHTLFKDACFDCHSNNSSYPWYFYIQPVGWMLAKDIRDGKEMLNFNEMESLSPRRQMSKLQDVENRMKDGTMPLPAYQLMHSEARLTEEQRRLLIDWIQKTKDTIDSQR